MLDAMIFILAIGSIFIIISAFFNYDFLRQESRNLERALGLYTNPNRAGNVACIAQTFTAFAMAHSSRIGKKTLTLFFVINVLAALLTFSKAAFIITGVNLLLLMKLNGSRRNNIKAINRLRYFTVLMVFGILFNFNSINNSLSRHQKERVQEVELLLAGNINVETTTKRSYLANYALSKISERPITGHGLGTFSHMDIGSGTHNQFLVFLGEGGIICFATYIMFFYYWYLRYRSLRYKALKYLHINNIIIILLISMTTHNVLTFKPFLLFLGFLLASLLLDTPQRVVNSS